LPATQNTPGHALLAVPVRPCFPVAHPLYCRHESLRHDDCTPDLN
jgi:hypothetical protein